jgi:oligoribonuclease
MTLLRRLCHNPPFELMDWRGFAPCRSNRRGMRMSKNESHLVWVDMEMSGLEPDRDRILEVAMVVTDKDLNLIAEGPVLVVHQSDAVLDAMDNWNKGTHGKSGLVDKVKASTLGDAEVEAQMLAFMKQHVPARTTPMCGNSICQDRRFMVRYMPALEAYFHYRNLDVSTLKELAKRWKPGIMEGFKKQNNHTALADIVESIEELKYYREHFIRVD